nr:MAG TPA: hypothetical protein [Caudoviricetes sp.]
MSRQTREVASSIKSFLDMVQPTPVKYGYPRGVKREESFVTYQLQGTQIRQGIGNTLISERQTYVITVQTKTALQNMIYSDMIRVGTHRKQIEFVSDSLRKDTTVESGYINTIIVRAFNGKEIIEYTAEEVRSMLQEIADTYIFITNRYDETISQSFIETYEVPLLEDRYYTQAEVIEMKREYLDRAILKTTEY